VATSLKLYLLSALVVVLLPLSASVAAADPVPAPPMPSPFPTGASVVASGPMGSGATWNVLDGHNGCVYAVIHANKSTGSTNLCPRTPIHSPQISSLSDTDAPSSDLALIAAKPSTRRLVTTSESPTGQRKTIKAKRIAAPANGYSVFLAVLPYGSAGIHAAASR